MTDLMDLAEARRIITEFAASNLLFPSGDGSAAVALQSDTDYLAALDLAHSRRLPLLAEAIAATGAAGGNGAAAIAGAALARRLRADRASQPTEPAEPATAPADRASQPPEAT